METKKKIDYMYNEWFQKVSILPAWKVTGNSKEERGLKR